MWKNETEHYGIQLTITHYNNICRITLGIMTFGKMAPIIMTFSKMAFGEMTLSIMSFGKIALS